MQKVNITDWQRKFADLNAWAKAKGNVQSASAMIKFFYPNIDASEFKSVQAGLHNFGVRSTARSHAMGSWLQQVSKAIGFKDTPEMFVSMPHLVWRSACAPEFQQLFTPASQTAVAQPTIHYDPESHNYQLAGGHDDQGVFDQRFMYTDRRAASQWSEVRGRETYGLYSICRALSVQSAQHIKQAKPPVDELILLGAGSPDKDWAIVQTLSKGRKTPLNVNICDASPFMLMETHNELERLKRNNRQHFDAEPRFHLASFDFTRQQGWLTCDVDRSKPALIAILGGTVGNVGERALFQCIRANTKPGDLVLIAGSFYPSVEALETSGEAHIHEQYGDNARALSLNSFSNLLDEANSDWTYADKIGLVDVGFEDATSLPDKIASRVPGTKAAVFSIDVARIQHPPPTIRGMERVYLVTSRRYVKANLISHLAVNYALDFDFEVQSAGSLFPFSHLIFRRR